MVRFLLAAVLAATISGTGLAPTPVADASEQWCEIDPLVLITTPGGALVPVFVTSAAPLVHQLAVVLAELRYTATSTADGQATRVQLSVLIRDDLLGHGFPTRTTVSTGPLKTGAILGTASGVSGEPMRVVFVLDVS
ncbi:MAG: hypothetical protein ACRDJN_29880 [Chloroflexota bacterium]